MCTTVSSSSSMMTSNVGSVRNISQVVPITNQQAQIATSPRVQEQREEKKSFFSKKLDEVRRDIEQSFGQTNFSETRSMFSKFTGTMSRVDERFSIDSNNLNKSATSTLSSLYHDETLSPLSAFKSLKEDFQDTAEHLKRDYNNGQKVESVIVGGLVATTTAPIGVGLRTVEAVGKGTAKGLALTGVTVGTVLAHVALQSTRAVTGLTIGAVGLTGTLYKGAKESTKALALGSMVSGFKVDDKLSEASTSISKMTMSALKKIDGAESLSISNAFKGLKDDLSFMGKGIKEAFGRSKMDGVSAVLGSVVAAPVAIAIRGAEAAGKAVVKGVSMAAVAITGLAAKAVVATGRVVSAVAHGTVAAASFIAHKTLDLVESGIKKAFNFLKSGVNKIGDYIDSKSKTKQAEKAIDKALADPDLASIPPKEVAMPEKEKLGVFGTAKKWFKIALGKNETASTVISSSLSGGKMMAETINGGTMIAKGASSLTEAGTAAASIGVVSGPLTAVGGGLMIYKGAKAVDEALDTKKNGSVALGKIDKRLEEVATEIKALPQGSPKLAELTKEQSELKELRAVAEQVTERTGLKMKATGIGKGILVLGSGTVSTTAAVGAFLGASALVAATGPVGLGLTAAVVTVSVGVAAYKVYKTLQREETNERLENKHQLVQAKMDTLKAQGKENSPEMGKLREINQQLIELRGRKDPKFAAETLKDKMTSPTTSPSVRALAQSFATEVLAIKDEKQLAKPEEIETKIPLFHGTTRVGNEHLAFV